jgi:microcystin-dependent protein
MGYVGNQQAEGFVQRPTKQDLTGATGTSLTLTHAVSKEEDIDLYINNVKQEPTTAYTVADTAVTLTGSVVASDDIYVVYNSLALQTVTPPDGSITEAKLVSGFGLIPVGMIAPFAMSTAPTGWLECDGSAVSRTTYADLFTALGTTHGSGDGSTTFNVPDLRGEFIRGWDNGKGTDSGRTFGSSQTDELKSHFHRPYNYSSDSTRRFFTGYGSTSGGYSYPASGGVGTLQFTDVTAQTDPTGGTETRPRNIAMMYCVKA